MEYLKFLVITAFMLIFCSCQRSTGIYVARGNFSNGFESGKYKVKIKLSTDSSFYITSTRKSNKTDNRKVSKSEQGKWESQNDTIILKNNLLHTLALIDNKYLIDINRLYFHPSVTEQEKKERLKVLGYKKKLF